MAFGAFGAATAALVDRDTVLIGDGVGPTLAARVGAPNIAMADTGEVTTAVAVVNQNGLPQDFGPGRGRWRADDLNFLELGPIDDQGDAATAGGGHLAAGSPRIVASDLVITFHNRSAGTSGPFRIFLRFRRRVREVTGLAERS